MKADAADHSFPAADDSGTVAMREPRQSWKANVFWGLAFGLPLALPPWFMDDVDALEKYGSVGAGVVWMALMFGMAIMHRGRRISCDHFAIDVSHPFGGRRILLTEVARVARRNVDASLKRLEEIGMTQQQKARRLDTMPPIVMYVLYDAQGRELLRVDRDMEPADQMQRFLRRMERVTGHPIAEE